MAYDQPPWRTALIAAGTGLATLAALKFFYILAEAGFDISEAPVAFIVPIVALIFGVVLASDKGPSLRRVGCRGGVAHPRSRAPRRAVS